MANYPEGAEGEGEAIVASPAPDIIQQAAPPEAWLVNLAAIARACGRDYVTVPDAVKGRPNSILSIMLTGHELRLGPMESLRLLSVINGQITVAAELKGRWIREAGGKIDVLVQNQNRTRLKGTRSDGAELEVEWALYARTEWEGTELEPAEDAQIISNITTYKKDGVQHYMIEKDNYSNYPLDMLWARCVSQLHRRLFPDTRGAWVYSTEEMSGTEE